MGDGRTDVSVVVQSGVMASATRYDHTVAFVAPPRPPALSWRQTDDKLLPSGSALS